jgi:hypothetical protein
MTWLKFCHLQSAVVRCGGSVGVVERVGSGDLGLSYRGSSPLGRARALPPSCRPRLRHAARQGGPAQRFPSAPTGPRRCRDNRQDLCQESAKIVPGRAFTKLGDAIRDSSEYDGTGRQVSRVLRWIAGDMRPRLVRCAATGRIAQARSGQHRRVGLEWACRAP